MVTRAGLDKYISLFKLYIFFKLFTITKLTDKLNRIINFNHVKKTSVYFTKCHLSLYYHTRINVFLPLFLSVVLPFYLQLSQLQSQTYQPSLSHHTACSVAHGPDVCTYQTVASLNQTFSFPENSQICNKVNNLLSLRKYTFLLLKNNSLDIFLFFGKNPFKFCFSFQKTFVMYNKLRNFCLHL